jgi:hypothetical protein
LQAAHAFRFALIAVILSSKHSDLPLSWKLKDFAKSSGSDCVSIHQADTRGVR